MDDEHKNAGPTDGRGAGALPAPPLHAVGGRKLKRFGILTLVALVVGGAYVVFRAAAPQPPSRYPELEAVPRAELERARRALPKKGDDRSAPREALRLDGCTPGAIVATLLERARPPQHTLLYGPCFEDEDRRPVGAWLASQRDETLTPLLVRLASDERIEFDLRDTAVVALAWKGNAQALPGLIRLAMDKEVDPVLRTRVFSRLVRIGLPPGDPFEDLLCLPFREHDTYAAAVLALTGKPVAPSQIVEALSGPILNVNDREHLLVRAAAAIAAGDPAVAVQARLAQVEIETSWGLYKSSGAPVEQVIADLASVLVRWLAQHPQASESRYERERRAYREGPRHAAEQHVLAAERPADIPEERIDFGAAALRIADPEKHWTEWHLDRLDRLAALFRRDLKDVTSPLDKLEILHRRLLPRHMSVSSSMEVGPSSFLPHVLRDRGGNCAGLTSLYVALGERLDLPLVAVKIPRHVFLRWDDGITQLDIELTDLGRLRTDEDLNGATPRVLTKKGLASVALSNRSNTWLKSSRIRPENRVEEALRLAEEALAYDADNDTAHLVRASCLARLGDEEGALAAAERALELAPLDVTSPMVAAECLFTAGRTVEALKWFDRARELEPANGDALQGRLQCLTRLGRDEEILAEATAFLDANDHHGVRLARLGALVKLDRDGWEAELTELAASPPGSWTLRLSVAELLLGQDAAAGALRVLTPLADLEKEGKAARGKEGHQLVVLPGDARQVILIPAEALRSWYEHAQRLKARAYESLGRADEAAAIRRELSD